MREKKDITFEYDISKIKYWPERLVYRDDGTDVKDKSMVTLLNGDNKSKYHDGRKVVHARSRQYNPWVYKNTDQLLDDGQEPKKIGWSYFFNGREVETRRRIKPLDNNQPANAAIPTTPTSTIINRSIFQEQSDLILKRKPEASIESIEAKRTKLTNEIVSTVTSNARSYRTNAGDAFDKDTLSLITKYHLFREIVEQKAELNSTVSENEAFVDLGIL